MPERVDIEFDQLLKIVMGLPLGQLKQLKAEIEKEPQSRKKSGPGNLAFKGSYCQKKQLDTISKTEKLSPNGG